MKINGKEVEGNVSFDDGRVGWKYPLRSKDISKACDEFLKNRGIKQYNLTGRPKKKNELPEM